MSEQPLSVEVIETPTEELMVFLRQMESGGLRPDWFPFLYRQLDQYKLWALVRQGSRVVASSCVQQRPFPGGCVRVLTRTFMEPEARVASLVTARYLTEGPPGLMLRAQLNWLRQTENFQYAFVSMEPHRSHRNFSRMMRLFNQGLGESFETLEGTWKTYQGQAQHLYQRLSFLSLKPGGTSAEFQQLMRGF